MRDNGKKRDNRGIDNRKVIGESLVSSPEDTKNSSLITNDKNLLFCSITLEKELIISYIIIIKL